MSLLMSLRFVLGLLALVSSTAGEGAAGRTLPPYNGCPPITLDGCECSEYDLQPTVTANVTNTSIDSCLTHLSENGHTMLLRLNVKGRVNLNVTANFLKDVLVKSLYFNKATIVQVDENFLGDSSLVTTDLVFKSCTLKMGIPKINGEAITRLKYYDVNLRRKPKLPTYSFSGTPSLEDLNINPETGTPSITVARNVFRNLTQLREVQLYHSISLTFGSLHFTSPQLTKIHLGYGKSYTLDIIPGSISGVPASAKLLLDGTISGGWQSSKLFNLIQSGVLIRRHYTDDCDCSMAWIRYSSFVDNVKIQCSEGYLKHEDLSHCPFYKNLNQTELGPLPSLRINN